MDAPAWVYPAAAVVLVVLSAESARRPFVAPVGARFGARSGGDGATRIGSSRVSRSPKSASESSVRCRSRVPCRWRCPIGVLLVTVQGAQVQTIESRRDAGGRPGCRRCDARGRRICSRITRARRWPCCLPSCLLLVAAALVAARVGARRTRAADRSAEGRGLAHALRAGDTAIVIAALAFLAMPNSLRLGTEHQRRPCRARMPRQAIQPPAGRPRSGRDTPGLARAWRAV